MEPSRFESTPGQEIPQAALDAIGAAKPTPPGLRYVLPPDQDEEVPEEELTRMIIAATTRQPYRWKTPAQRKLFERIKAEVEALPPGTVVEVPSELP